MQAFSISILQFLLALATVYLVAKASGLDSLLDPIRGLWRSCGLHKRLFVLFLVPFVAFYAVSKEGLRSGPQSQINLPEWFVERGHGATDGDGDGIPDCWERWTHTDRDSNDAMLDPDGDGVDNLAEFWNQTDPLLPDTDGDDYSDYVEIAGRAIGKTWFDPLVPARYEYDDPDSNTNGVPDRWEGTGYVYGFTDANGDGFPDGLAFPEEGDGNFDIDVTVTASRSALFSWGEGTNQMFVVPPCTGLVVRLRLSGYTDNEVRLAAAMPGDGSTGLWRASMDFGWPTARSQTTEGGRIILLDGTVIDCETPSVEFMGEATTETLRGSTGGPTSISGHFLRKIVHVECHGGYCREHDVGEFYAVADYTNVAPPFVWFVDGNLVPDVPGDTLGGSLIFQYGGGDTFHTVRCVATNGPTHEFILAEDMDFISAGHCTPGSTNLFPITSLDGFDAVTNHAPALAVTPIHNAGPCPDTERVDIWAGFRHGVDEPWDRNFETIPTGDAKDDSTSHCIAVDWSENLEIDLEYYLPTWLLDYRDKLRFRVDGTLDDSSVVRVGKVIPEDLLPEIHHAEICTTEGATLDRLWITILNPGTRTIFNGWVAGNATNATWLSVLPRPPSRIIVNPSTGTATLPAAASADWDDPEPFPANSFMHPKAVYELRSHAVGDAHGHQATYDAQGHLITENIKAGTADFSTPYPVAMWWRPINHREEDVKPYIRSLQLDGNPVLPVNNGGTISTSVPRNLSRPPLRVGPFTQQYLQRRPTTPTGVLIIP